MSYTFITPRSVANLEFSVNLGGWLNTEPVRFSRFTLFIPADRHYSNSSSCK